MNIRGAYPGRGARGLAAALALLLAMAGCALGGAEPAPPPIESAAEDRQMVVVDNEERADLETGREYPGAGADPYAASGSESVQAQSVAKTVSGKEEIRSVWISYLELETLLGGKTEGQFRSNMAAVFDNVKNYGLNTVVVHVRPFGDALYRSDYFPWSHIATGTEGKDPGFDPLAVMLEEAKKRELRFEAWINPYRVRHQNNKKPLSADNPASQWMAGENGSVIEYNGGISYNPASTRAQELIVNGVRELVRGYDVDAIHIDDYFYPTTDAAFDRDSYQAYAAGGGSLALGDWRRANVEQLIRKLYAAVKEENPAVQFGISPQSSVGNNYNEQYLDVKKIAAGAGYCDYLCPQIYFGFQNDIQPYSETLSMWSEMVTAPGVGLYVGIAAYKAGGPDSWAGSGSEEWRQNTDLLARMVEEARLQPGYQGFVLYRYESLFQPESGRSSHVGKERENLRAVL